MGCLIIGVTYVLVIVHVISIDVPSCQGHGDAKLQLYVYGLPTLCASTPGHYIDHPRAPHSGVRSVNQWCRVAIICWTFGFLFYYISSLPSRHPWTWSKRQLVVYRVEKTDHRVPGTTYILKEG